MKREPKFNQLTLFNPESPWKRPAELPDLSNVDEVAIDTEEKDPSLAKDKGPGFYAYERTNPNTGFICGLSAAWGDEHNPHKVYVPLRHPDTECFDYDTVRRWLKALARQRSTRFIFHSFQFDWGWIQATFNIEPPEQIDDVSAMASMVNENLDSFSLDYIAKWLGLAGKDERLLKEAMARFKVPPDKIKQYLWQMEGKYVGPYAEEDAGQTLGAARILRPMIAEENLDHAYNVERRLMPITLKMKQQGIRVDVDKADQLATQLEQSVQEDLYRLSSSIGEKVEIKNVRQNQWLKRQFDKEGIYYPKTLSSKRHPDGQASFEKEFLSKHKHWLPRAVYDIRHKQDLAKKFLRKYIISYAHKGRVYPSVNQFRSEEGGARTHRFSYSDPPLQQTPSRDDEYAALIRQCFIPEDGQDWCSIDYRQQEYRLIVFVAELLRKPGARQAADMYRKDPNTDFHNYVVSITRLPRPRAKDTNFAKSYGAGKDKFALMTGMDLAEAIKTMDIYDEHLPFVKKAAEHYNRYAAANGHIRMIDGARRHFNLWEPVYRDYSREDEYKSVDPNISTAPCFIEEAERRKEDSNHPWYGERFKRAYTHKAFNSMIQGSGARQMKEAMCQVYDAGYLPLLQVHDELGFSFSSQADAFEAARIMENACPQITIPMLTDIKWGNNWGHLEIISL